MTELVRLPELRQRQATPPASGWFVLVPPANVSVPTLEDARRCDDVPAVPESACDPRVLRFDPPHRTAIIDRGAGVLVVSARIAPAFAPDEVPVLLVRPALEGAEPVHLPGRVLGPCRDELRFEWPLDTVEDGAYELSLEGFSEPPNLIALGRSSAELLAPDPCALTLKPAFRLAGIALEQRPPSFPRPPLLAVDTQGCVVEAWSVNELGWVLVPRGDTRVDLLLRPSGGVIARLELDAPIRDAIFWREGVAVLTASELRLFDLQGCPAAAGTFAAGFDGAVALGVTSDDFLAVVQTGTSATRPGNLHVFRRDGTAVRAPVTFEARGFYAGLRSRALVFDEQVCVYRVEPSRVSSGCCASPATLLDDEQSLFFRLIDDLRDLRRRAAFPASGQVVIGPALERDPLDSGRPGTQWHRVLLFGEVPEGCGVRLETRAFDDLVAGDPLLVPDGWSTPVTASSESAAPVRAPGDTRVAAADAMVLARPGRYLWLRITLLSNGVATPRVTAIEVERPRAGIARFLPQVFQSSTPEDDFLRRWLAIFENTAFDGVALRLDQYEALFDPRTAPREMLPFLAGWLEVLENARLRDDEVAFRRVLMQADALARTRGTIEGLRLAVRLYMGIEIQIVEGFKRRAGFILGTGVQLDGVVGPALGSQTTLCGESSATWLDEEPALGCAYLLDCDDACGSPPFQFDVVVSARDVCTTAARELLQLIVETEKPAHTAFAIRPSGVAGWVVGVQSVVGQEISVRFDRDELDPTTFGIALANGPPRPKPLERGFALGIDSRLATDAGQPGFRLGATLGRTTRVSAGSTRT